ncbi:MAG: ion channel [Candidatus Nanopelagicales bacterium]
MAKQDEPARVADGATPATGKLPADSGSGARGMLFRTPLFDDRSRYLDHFGWLLTLTALTVACLSLLDPGARFGDTAEEVLELGAGYLGLITLLLAFAASGLAHRRLVILMVMMGLFAVLQTLLVLSALAVERAWAAPPVGNLLFSLAAFSVIVRRLARHVRVTKATLLGAVTAYLFIPLTYFYAYRVLNAVQPGSMFGQHESSPTFMFFSLTTVTTVGYGDPEPVGNLARLLATSEALVGQLFLVTVVALIVGRMSASQHERSLAEQATRARRGEDARADDAGDTLQT